MASYAEIRDKLSCIWTHKDTVRLFWSSPSVLRADPCGQPLNVASLHVVDRPRTIWTRVAMLLFPWSVVCVTVANTGMSECLLFLFTLQSL